MTFRAPQFTLARLPQVHIYRRGCKGGWTFGRLWVRLFSAKPSRHMLSGMEPRHRLGFRLLTKLRPCDASVPCDLIPETTPLRLCVCARVGCAVAAGSAWASNCSKAWGFRGTTLQFVVWGCCVDVSDVSWISVTEGRLLFRRKELTLAVLVVSGSAWGCDCSKAWGFRGSTFKFVVWVCWLEVGDVSWESVIRKVTI